MHQLKPALTYDELIDRLKKAHNLVIRDDQVARAILEKVNYYRLSAYGIGLTRKDDKEKYIDGTTIEHLFRLHEFDSLFRNALMHVIEQIEIQLRNQISHYLALKYGAEGYLDKDNFTDKKTKEGELVHLSVMESFQKERDHQKNVPFVKHHMDKYEGHFPIWVAIELFSFGNLSSLYSILKLEDRKRVADLYHTEANHLGSWLLALVEIRNNCAHYSRIYNMPLKQTPFLYSEYRKYKIGTINKVFPTIIVIKRMLAGDERWLAFEKQLENLIDEYDDVVNLSFMGFPKEWKDVLSRKVY